ncbi:hypothetical protein CH359_08085 [Leptospira meyeri]|nr:hypothetical protein CH359_08085 [Leptospira meyeri]PJZ96542.1 hypothetical protein CH358_09755 [Leptospira meyeri]PKA12888.1 hypothetical protein CH372_06545 [Leptospira meyeri]PKA22817.1 hypothetical protein CH381_28960 [Leptospira sp. mixed culture ATI2-C-A1]
MAWNGFFHGQISSTRNTTTCLEEGVGIPVAIVRGPEKIFGTDDRLRAIHMWEDPTFLIFNG